jgi:hypothetical protein
VASFSLCFLLDVLDINNVIVEGFLIKNLRCCRLRFHRYVHQSIIFWTMNPSKLQFTNSGWCNFDAVPTICSGFTGSLVVEYLSKNYPSGLSWAIAGRDMSRLSSIQSKLNLDPSVGLLIADSNDSESLDKLASQSKVWNSTGWKHFCCHCNALNSALLGHSINCRPICSDRNSCHWSLPSLSDALLWYHRRSALDPICDRQTSWDSVS